MDPLITPRTACVQDARRPKIFQLHSASRSRVLVEVVPGEGGLYRIAWPDIGLSPPANLTRCKQAAEEWAERHLLTEQRHLSVAQRLKSLKYISWSASPVRSLGRRHPRTRPRRNKAAVARAALEAAE
jgi:hypothetical protein